MFVSPDGSSLLLSGSAQVGRKSHDQASTYQKAHNFNLKTRGITPLT